ncbi:MAG: bifunctional diguanylate cyclase/phosphodiesterase [Campylobacterota bacterium]|nr:bifunctional diguanylate cyclase/phosphodiesterase [Campylobacterota bacterium]
MVKKSDFLLILTLFIFGIFFVYLYFYIENTQQEIRDRMVQNKINHMSHVFSHIEDELLKIKGSNDLVSSLENNKPKRYSLEAQLTQMISKNTKYTYLLFLDKDKKFRFLLDGSIDDKARFYQKFDPLKKDIYLNVYKTKSSKTIFQKDMENLLITLLYPVKQNGEVLAILSIDMTTEIQNEISRLMEPLKNFFIVLIVFIFLLLSIGVIQLFKYFRTRKQLFQDPLTKLFNRNYFEEISPLLNLEHYSIAMLDLDRFKVINDTYGHKAGDLVLQESAEIFKNSIRDSDIIIRFGGEEFLLFINKRGEEDASFDVCTRIRKNIAKHTFKYEDDEINMTLSIGLHQSPKFEKNLLNAIKQTDSMLYLAKQRGRDQIVNHSENTKNAPISNRKGVSDVKSALNEDRIICHFQPIVDVKHKNILKYEALVRILSTDGKIIYPGDFLPYIKHTNIHYKLTKKILEICFNIFSQNQKQVSINISFLDLLNRDIVEYITENLQNNKPLASRITFEILESDEIEDIDVFRDKIDILHKLGTKIAIDDFGSGYSNFKAVLDIRADFLKIDGTLIKEIATDEKVFQVVRNIILFAKDSGMRTVAEFVCSKEIYDRLIILDIDYMQGFYLAKPSENLIEDDLIFKEMLF